MELSRHEGEDLQLEVREDCGCVAKITNPYLLAFGTTAKYAVQTIQDFQRSLQALTQTVEELRHPMGDRRFVLIKKEWKELRWNEHHKTKDH